MPDEGLMHLLVPRELMMMMPDEDKNFCGPFVLDFT